MTEKKTIIVFPRGTLDAKTKEMLSKNGYLGIEADDPTKVVTVLPLAGTVSPLSPSEIVQAMAIALNENEQRRQAFGRALLNMISAKGPAG
jgi:hypothetical protein